MHVDMENTVHQTSAHVFKIDPTTKKTWIPCSKTSVPVRVVKCEDGSHVIKAVSSIEEKNTIISSELVPGMIFTKTAPKFGQWADTKAGTLYGLGFGSETETIEFAEIFSKISSGIEDKSNTQSLPPQVAPKPQTAKANSGSKKSTADMEDLNPAATLSTQNTASSLQRPQANNVTVGIPLDSQEVATLRYENERLRTALATSGANAKKWEDELQTLRNTNTRLKTALQESGKNVLEWKKQLTAWKDETTRLKALLKEREDHTSSNEVEKEALTKIEDDLKTAHSELSDVKQQLIASQEAERTALDKNQALEGHVQHLELQIKNLTKVSEYQSKFERLVEDMEAWKTSYANKVADLDDLHVALGALLER
eukprot:gene10641-2756_t